ncbi:MAG: hypothetical protein ACYCS1_11230 [Gammaproteobacteria bacterium]
MNVIELGIMRRDNAGDWDGKRRFALVVRGCLKAIADAMGLKKDEYDLRQCYGGTLVNGEVSLHTNTIYVCVGGIRGQVLVRACRGRRDHTGVSPTTGWISPCWPIRPGWSITSGGSRKNGSGPDHAENI